MECGARTSSVGHKGRFGHEYLEFEFRPDGRLRYANNSNYKKDTIIRKEGTAPECWARPVRHQRAHPRGYVGPIVPRTRPARSDREPRRADRGEAHHHRQRNPQVRRRHRFGISPPASWRACSRPPGSSRRARRCGAARVSREDDRLWPEADRIGRQELEIVLNNEHISFTVRRPHPRGPFL